MHSNNVCVSRIFLHIKFDSLIYHTARENQKNTINF